MVVNDQLSTGLYIGVVMFISKVILIYKKCPGNLNIFMLIIFEINGVTTATWIFCCRTLQGESPSSKVAVKVVPIV